MSPAPRQSGLLVAVLLAAVASGCRPQEEALRFPRAPIVLISIDTLRADRLPAYGYDGVETPSLDALASESLLFESAWSHYPLTLPSHTSMLSGLLPPRHGVRDNAGYELEAGIRPWLPERLRAAGYATGAFVSSYVLRAATGLARGFDHYDDEIERPAGASLDAAQREGLATVARAAAWVRGRSETPFFLFLHLYEPHTPYAPPEPFASRYADPYDGEVATVDLVVGGFLEELRRLGLYERSILVFTADHGEGLGDHGEQQHGVFLYPSTTHVPLLLRLPGARRGGERIADAVALADLAPTLAGLAGIELGASPDGSSLLAAKPGDAAQRRIYAETYYPRLHFGWSDLKALHDARWSFVEAPEPELYDRLADPRLETNLVERERRLFAARRAEVREIDRPLAPPAAADEETAARLAALGYLSGGARTLEGPLPDPKSQRHLIGDIENGFLAFGERRFTAAAAHFERVLAENDGMFDIWSFLARSRKESGDLDGAARAWERALEISGDPGVALAAANVLLELGRYDEARARAELGLVGQPQPAHDLLVRIALAVGDGAAADRWSTAALAAGVASEGIRRRLALAAAESGRPAEAAALLDPVRESATAATLDVLGLALSDLGRHAEGAEVLVRAVALEPEAAKWREDLGTVLLRAGRLEEARAALDRAVALDRRRAGAWTALGVARYQAGDARGALAAWRTAVEVDSRAFDALYNLGLAAAAAGEPEMARRALGRFLATAPPARYGGDFPRARAALAQLGGGG